MLKKKHKACKHNQTILITNLEKGGEVSKGTQRTLMVHTLYCIT